MEDLLLSADADMGTAISLLTKPRAPPPDWKRTQSAADGMERCIPIEEKQLFRIANNDITLPSRVSKKLKSL